MEKNHEELGMISRRLKNGMEVVSERIEENDKEIVFEFKFAEPTDDATLFGLRELYAPETGNDIIYQKLVAKGWVGADGNTTCHFKMDVDRDDKNRQFKFRYYLADSGEKVN